jgi:hypothetical protein
MNSKKHFRSVEDYLYSLHDTLIEIINLTDYLFKIYDRIDRLLADAEEDAEMMREYLFPAEHAEITGFLRKCRVALNNIYKSVDALIMTIDRFRKTLL